MRAGPPTARPLASTSSALLTPPSALLGDLAALRDPARVSDDLWSETTEQCVLWLLKVDAAPGASRPAVDPSGKGKGRALTDEDGVALEPGLVHWFCGAHGARDCWEPAVFCIRLLGMKRVGEVGNWRDRYERYASLSFTSHAKGTIIVAVGPRTSRARSRDADNPMNVAGWSPLVRLASKRFSGQSTNFENSELPVARDDISLPDNETERLSSATCATTNPKNRSKLSRTASKTSSTPPSCKPSPRLASKLLRQQERSRNGGHLESELSPACSRPHSTTCSSIRDFTRTRTSSLSSLQDTIPLQNSSCRGGLPQDCWLFAFIATLLCDPWPRKASPAAHACRPPNGSSNREWRQSSTLTSA